MAGSRLAVIGIGLWVCLTGSPMAQRVEPWKRHTIDASSLGADGVRAADANGDGAMDLVTSWEQGGLTRIYLADRSSSGGAAWKVVTAGKSPDAEDAVFFDADGDGDLDIISSAEGRSRRILVHWAPPAGGLHARKRMAHETLYRTDLDGCSPFPWTSIGRAAPISSSAARHEGASNRVARIAGRPAGTGDWTFHRLSDAGWISTHRQGHESRRASRRVVERSFREDGRRALARESGPDIGDAERTVDESLGRRSRRARRC